MYVLRYMDQFPVPTGSQMLFEKSATYLNNRLGMTQLLYKQAHKNTLTHTHYSVMYMYTLVNNASWSIQHLASE